MDQSENTLTSPDQAPNGMAESSEVAVAPLIIQEDRGNIQKTVESETPTKPDSIIEQMCAPAIEVGFESLHDEILAEKM